MTAKQQIILVAPAHEESPRIERLRQRLVEAGLDIHLSRHATEAVAHLAERQGNGDAAADLRVDAPAAALIALEPNRAVAVARSIRAASAHLHIIFLGSPEQREEFRRVLGLAPMIGSHWSVLDPEAPSLPHFVIEAVASSRQRRQFRTTLDRMNVRISAGPPVDSREYRKLVASDHYLANLLRHAHDAIISLDAAGHVVSWNDGAERLLKIPHSSAVGQPVQRVTGWFEGFPELLQRVLAGETVAGYETQCVVGVERVDVELSLSPVIDEAARLLGAVAILRDVTERNRDRRRLRESEERLRLGLEAGNTGTWDWDLLTDQITCSDRIYEFYGLNPAESSGKVAELIDIIHPDDRERISEAIQKAIEHRAVYNVEFRVARADGTVRWLAAAGRVYYDDYGKPVRMLGATSDVTQRTLADQERARLLEGEREAREEAERISRMKDEFLSTVSHELRTPLNAILGWAQIIRIGQVDQEEMEQGLEVIWRNARAQVQIIEDLLDMSRIISGKVRLDVRRVDLPEVIDEAVASMQPAADAKGIRVQKVLDPLAGPVTGDPSRLQQVVWNLLSNAVKFTPRGGRIRVTLERVNSHVEISVSDTGEGIAPDFLPHVFERFRQADGNTTRRHGGLGLGLAIVKNIVELHGGTINAKSLGKNHGSTFRVALPLTPLHTIEEQDREHPTAESDHAPPYELPTLSDVHVLVVEDDADARNLTRKLLEDGQATVTSAAAADAALEMLRSTRFNVIVSDIGMPQRDGYEFIRELRSWPAEMGGRTPAVAMTALARSQDRTRALVAGFDMHVAKPVDPGELYAVIASLAGRGQ